MSLTIRSAFAALPLLAVALLACRSQPSRSAGHEVGGVAGRIVTAPSPRAPGQLRILLQYDMEGLSGQSDWRTQEYRFSMVAGDLYDLVAREQLEPVHPATWTLGQNLLVADVNAVLDGLFAGGASSVDVLDRHGSGNPEVDLPPDRLHHRARHLPVDTGPELIERGRYDAVVLVAQHSGSGTGGFLSHTGSAGTRVVYNGAEVTEADMAAYRWGEVGVPVIFVSGDERLGQDVQAKMPWAQYVSVKRALGPAAAELRPLEEAHADLRQGAEAALKDPGRWRVIRLSTPISAEVCAVAPASLAKLASVPAVDYADDCVSFAAPDYQTASRGTIALLNLAGALGYSSILLETVLAESNGVAILDRSNERGARLWEQAEALAWER